MEGEDTTTFDGKPRLSDSSTEDRLFGNQLMLPPRIKTGRELRRSISTGNLELAGGLNRMMSTKTFGGLPKVDEEGFSGQ